MTALALAASETTTLADELQLALDTNDALALDLLADARPDGPRDRLMTLLAIYDLHTAPLDRVGPAVRFQHHPAVAALKTRCESDWLDDLAAIPLPDEPQDALPVLRAMAAHDRLPTIYRWLARSASWSQVVRFLALEGGPDAGFDDLVASAQVGLTGPAKMELAVNYWDEMGDGDPTAVHTTLHEQLAAAVDLPALPAAELPTSALARTAFGGLLASNRWLQPEMLGALGLIELQAGPRCRLVLQALERCGAPAGARPFYAVHAEVDPRHGKDWMDKAIAPIQAETPAWIPGIIRGAAWRDALNRAFLDDAYAMLATDGDTAG